MNWAPFEARPLLHLIGLQHDGVRGTVQVVVVLREEFHSTKLIVFVANPRVFLVETMGV